MGKIISFNKKKLETILKSMTLNDLKRAINAGLKELQDLVSDPNRPKNWFRHVKPIEKTLGLLKAEIEKRKE